MKTRTLTQILGSIFLGGFLAVGAFAGPGPQYWSRPAEKPAAKTEAAKMNPSSDKCEGCKTTRIWKINDRGPAGKGASGAAVVGQSHSCTRCTGTIETKNGKAASSMVQDARCADLLCCK